MRHVVPWVARLVAAWVVLGAQPAAASSWSVVPTVEPVGASSSVLSGVSCTPNGVCVAVGYSRGTDIYRTRTLAERWSGGSWRVMPTPNPSHATASQLNAVSCVSASDCTAVGLYSPRAGATRTLVERLRGGAWTIEASPTVSGADSLLFGVSCIRDVCVVVGASQRKGQEVSGRLVERRQAGKWRVQRTPGSSALYSVSCTSGSFCMAAGGGALSWAAGGAAVRWDGRIWRRAALGLTSSATSGLACTSPSACVAVGGVAPSPHAEWSTAQRWDGRRWSRQPVTPNGGYLVSVSCPHLGAGASACYAVGGIGFDIFASITLAAAYNGARWKVQPTPNPGGSTPDVSGSGPDNGLASVSCWRTAAANACMAVGDFSKPGADSHALAEKLS